jgi:hypothetical protein
MWLLTLGFLLFEYEKCSWTFESWNANVMTGSKCVPLLHKNCIYEKKQ